MSTHLRKRQQSFSFDVASNLVDRGRQLMNLPHDVISNTLRILGQVLLILHDWGNNLGQFIMGLSILLADGFTRKNLR